MPSEFHLALKRLLGYDRTSNLLHRTNHTLVQSFGVNNLNQLTNQSRTGRMSVAGNTFAPATSVTVNTTNAIRYADHTFVSTNHTLVSGTNTFTAIAQDSLGRSDTHSISAYLPETSAFVYDSNGNMLFNGQKAFEWDDENQLIRITATNAWKSEFTYDGKMRRRIRKEFTWRNGAWVLTNEVRYIYDGNLVIQERDANNLAQVTYTRGKDLSGTLEGVGGVGGLLARTDNAQLTTGTGQSHAYYHADGNGNITMLISTQQGAAAKYLYDPFGNVIFCSGPLAEANLYRFSTKEWHRNSGALFYLYRPYVPAIQRWISKDPLGEKGGANLYGFIANNPLSYVDPFGLWGFPTWTPPGQGLDPIACGNNIKDQVWEKHKPTADDRSARMAHCVAHCRISRECPGGSLTSFLGGLGKEIQDEIKQHRNKEGDGYDSGDMNANSVGRKCAKKSDKSCEDSCSDAFNDGKLYPVPAPTPL